MDWRQKGRAAAHVITGGRIDYAGIWLSQSQIVVESTMRLHHGDLLAAARWGVARECRRSTLEATRDADAEALRLLVEGFRECATEIAGLKPTPQAQE